MKAASFCWENTGGGVSSQVAANQKVAGLILHSTFTSLPDLAKELFLSR